MRLPKHLLSLFVLMASCVTVPNTENCTVAGDIAGGAMCATAISGETRHMTADEYIEFLLPGEQPDGTPRAGAVCRTARDHENEKTAFEKACRMLGKRCIVPWSEE